MSTPDIQYFAASGTWHKPAGAVRVDALLRASGGGGAPGRDGEDGELHHWSRMAGEVGDAIEVEIGRAGRGAPGCGDGAAGYALFVTHLAVSE